MGRSRQATGKAVAALETSREERKAKDDRYRVHLASSIVSDMFDDHADCGFKDCRTAGRCLAFDKYTGVCPMPLDLNRSMIFIGMIWFHNAIRAAEDGSQAGPQGRKPGRRPARKTANPRGLLALFVAVK